jgi:hypothetical protein
MAFPESAGLVDALETALATTSDDCADSKIQLVAAIIKVLDTSNIYNYHMLPPSKVVSESGRADVITKCQCSFSDFRHALLQLRNAYCSLTDGEGWNLQDANVHKYTGQGYVYIKRTCARCGPAFYSTIPDDGDWLQHLSIDGILNGSDAQLWQPVEGQSPKYRRVRGILRRSLPQYIDKWLGYTESQFDWNEFYSIMHESSIDVSPFTNEGETSYDDDNYKLYGIPQYEQVPSCIKSYYRACRAAVQLCNQADAFLSHVTDRYYSGRITSITNNVLTDLTPDYTYQDVRCYAKRLADDMRQNLLTIASTFYVNERALSDEQTYPDPVQMWEYDDLQLPTQSTPDTRKQGAINAMYPVPHGYNGFCRFIGVNLHQFAYLAQLIGTYWR